MKTLFCRLLSERCKVDFMGIAEWFLGVHFSWRVTSSSVLVHTNQSGFTTNLVESSPSNLVTRHQRLLPTDLASPLILLLPRLMPMTPRPRSTAKKPFKVSLEASVGCHLPHARPHCGPLLLILLHGQTHLWSHESGPLRLTLHSLDAR